MDNSLNRSGITQEMNVSRYTDDDDSRIDEPQFENYLSSNNGFLGYMYEGLDLLSSQRFQEAIEVFSTCLEFVRSSKEGPASLSYLSALLNCNVALCHFYLGGLREAESSLNEAKASLNFRPGCRQEHVQLLYLKILCNFYVLYVKIRHFENVQKILKMLHEFISSERDALVRANLVSQVIYMMFRTESLSYYSPDKSDFSQQDASSMSYGIYLMILGLNFEFTHQRERASEEFFKAYEHWRNCEDEVMCLIVLRHLKHLYGDSPSTLARIEAMYRSQMKENNLSESSLEELFEAFEAKLRAVEELSKCLQSLEQLNSTHIAANRARNNMETIKFALKLGLKNSVALTKQLVRQARDPEKIRQLQESVGFMNRTLGMLESESSQAMINLLSKHPYVSSSVARLKSSLASISSGYSKFAFESAFSLIRQAANTRSQGTRKNPHIRSAIPFVSRPQAKPQLQGSLRSQQAREIVKTGDYLTKLNYTSNGSLRKFFRVTNNVSLRWAKKPASLSNPKSCHSYDFADIRGIVFGKCTSTFLRSKNKQLEPWLCFSLILKSRPLDLYIEESKIDFWYIGLSEYVKQHNPSASVLSKGKFYWRKLSLVIKYIVLLQIPEKLRTGMKKSFTFCKAVILYGELMKNNGAFKNAGPARLPKELWTKP